MFKLLLVDDEIASIEYLSKYIKKKNECFFKVYITNSAKNAKEILSNVKIDLVVCDVNMPEESGIEFMYFVMKKYPKIKLIMLSGYDDFHKLYEIQKQNIKFVSKLESEEYLLQIIQEELMGLKSKPKKEEQIVLMDKEEIITYVINYINENYHQDLSLEIIANRVYINPSYLSRIFKISTGKALFEYINDVRVKKAKEIVLDPNYKIKDVSKMVGYNSTTYFNKVFKLKVGLTPQQFRRNNI